MNSCSARAEWVRMNQPKNSKRFDAPLDAIGVVRRDVTGADTQGRFADR